MANSLTRGVRLVPGGLEIGGQVVPLHAAAIHYFRLDPADWRACLSAAKDMGVRLVDVYVPWQVHEVSPGVFDFGQREPRRDVAAFLRMAADLGLFAIARPGPHINAEMTCFGIPERVIWDPKCQARSPRQNPVFLPMLPLGFPVPSYASDAFFDEVARYFHALGPVLSPLLYPDGPVVLVQVDNEGAFYFRDGLYDQDYHPDAIRHYRAHLRDKYRTVEALPQAYSKMLARAARPPSPPRAPSPGGSAAPAHPPPPPPAHPPAPAPAQGRPAAEAEPILVTPSEPDTLESKAPAPDLRFASLEPPVRFDGASLDDLVVHLDWAEAQESLLASAFTRFRAALEDAGISGLPTMHNLPPGEEATPLSAAVVSRAVDLVGLDYYYQAGAAGRAVIARRTGELAAFCEMKGVPPYACEMGVGFPPFFPPLEERDTAFTILTALAFGLRGMNLYMAVERDRWIGAPIDRRGRLRPFAGFFRRLFSALESTSFHALRRRLPVRLVVPRSERRLGRALHAFGPFPGTVFAIANAGARERCIEDDLGTGAPIGIEVDTFVRAFEQALDARGVPFAVVEALGGEAPLGDAQWVVCATSGGLSPALFDRLAAAQASGAALTFGPRRPELDASMLPLSAPLPWEALREAGGDDVPLHIDASPAAVDNAVARAIESLGLPTFACDPHGVLATVHEDGSGRPRVLFLLNPTDSDLVARVSVPGAPLREAADALGDERIPVVHGAVEARIPPKTVRMLALD